MDQHQNQHQQQGGHPGPPPIAPSPHGMAPNVNGQQGITNQGQGNMAAHLAMMSNPGAFFAMPDLFTSNAVIIPQTGNVSAGGGFVVPQVPTQANMYSRGMGRQQQIQPRPQQVPKIPGGQPSMVAYGKMSMSQNGAAQIDATSAAQAIPVDSNEKGTKRKKDRSGVEKAKQNRDRNREHARSTRLRKKAYVQKLKELVEGLNIERSEEVRQRRVAIQHLSEVQSVRRAAIQTCLRFLSNNEIDKRKWSTILEESFWLKQPVTPYRYFRRSEIENVGTISGTEYPYVYYR